MKKLFVSLLFYIQTTMAQNYSTKLFEVYDSVKDSTITSNLITHSIVAERINFYKTKLENIIETETVGYSAEGREIKLLKIGKGKVKIFLWSQMHGDEPTATMALLDILSYIDLNKNEKELKTIFEKTTLLILPMLNPDGAERFQRRSVHEIDINRDALSLQTSEGKILKNICDTYKPNFGFNLHDQDPWNTAGQVGEVATISLLAPAYNYEKETNGVRKRAKHLAATIADVLNKFIKGKVAKYNDDFEPRAFGDNIQKWGTSTVLIESGGFPDDPQKMFIRKINFVAILSAIYSISTNNYLQTSIAKYESLPENKEMLYDVIIKNIVQTFPGTNVLPVKIDIGIKIDKQRSTIENKGDLRTFKAFKFIDAKGKEVPINEIKLESEIDLEKFLEKFK